MPFRITPPELESSCLSPWLRIDLYCGSWNPQAMTFTREGGPSPFGFVCQPITPRLNPSALRAERWIFNAGELQPPPTGKAWEMHFVPIEGEPGSPSAIAMVGPASSVAGLAAALPRFITDVIAAFVGPPGAATLGGVQTMQIQAGDYVVLVQPPVAPLRPALRLWRDQGVDREFWDDSPAEIGSNFSHFFVPTESSRPAPVAFVMH